MKFLVFQHIECEHPGIFRDLMREDGVSWDTVEIDEGETIPGPNGYDALLVMGGPMDVWETEQYPWLKPEIEFINQWVQSGRPYLGFCLGHQLLALAMGGDVGPAVQPEIGVMPVTLTDSGRQHWFFTGCGAEMMSLQWHSAEVTKVPNRGTVLASSEACLVNALGWGDRAVSVQFHVELTPSTVDEWGEIPAYAKALEKALGPNGMIEMQRGADHNMEQFNRLSSTLYSNFSKMVRQA